MNCWILGEKTESDLPGYLQHWLGRRLVILHFVWLECQYVPRVVEANCQLHFGKIVVPPQVPSGHPLPSRWAMTLDHAIQLILAYRIQQQPCSYVLITLNEHVISIGQLEARMHTQLLLAITCRTKYVANCVMWPSFHYKC